VSVSSDDLKKVLSWWTTGVTVVTARASDRIHGMTVSAFTEVSLDPPLVLVCADKASLTHPVIAEGRVFAVNILARDQQDLSRRFASKEDEHRRFEGLAYRTGKTGAPLLENTVAALDCRVVAAHDAGDHVIYVGKVEQVDLSADREPLLYQSGGYGSFRSDS
jgi:flavin reductase (DIM6/NTAB) family NADH-FMN oxidoreductase RutF